MRLSFWSVFLAGAATALAQTGKPRAIDFQREIRPILSDNCFQCHGPDSKTRMANLRLDQKDEALAARKNGEAIAPGSVAKSLLIARISDPNPARRMPPEYSHKKLTDAQIALLKAWIEQGAPWKEHWAFIAPVKPELPAVKNTGWAKTPIDRFLLAKMEEKGLAPAPPVDKPTLIRRVALDLTGLPPKPAEVEMFLKDSAADAYERMVDRYLASPHYGEHRARYWLDAARYGDTHGIHIDNYRDIWPYRDWVIGAYNRNLTFDQFTTEQLAGDLLPNPALDQRVATGFHRCNVTTSEGGIIDDEYAEVYAKDRADTTGAVFLGLTVGCATCHDHKFDPISQKDFYSLGAFFRNTTQPVRDGNVSDTPPVLLVPRVEDRARWDVVTAKLAAARSDLKKVRDSQRTAFEKWLDTRNSADPLGPLDGRDEGLVAKPAALKLPDTAKLGAGPVAGRQSVRFAKAGAIDTKRVYLDAEQPFSIAMELFLPAGNATYNVASQQDPKEAGNKGWTFDVTNRTALFRLFSEGNRSIEVRGGPNDLLRPNAWNDVVVTYNGSRQQSGLLMYVNGKRLASLARGVTAAEIAASTLSSQNVMLGKSFVGGGIADFRMLVRALTESEAVSYHQWPEAEAALAKAPADRKDGDKDQLLDYFVAHYCPPYQKLSRDADALATESLAISQRGAITQVMEERKDTKPTAYILYRGQYDQKRDKVEANTPSVLPPMTSDLPRNRLGFAKWLFRDDQPLTARVAVNRMWLEIFGTGIVKTADDFGSQGEPPSHPQLLDWLAVDFREHNWDMKRFYKQLLLSAAYRQSAQVTPEKIGKDPENRLLSRAPRFRMDAEMVRDYALAVSGLLTPQIGGPSVKPYQPEGVWEAVAMTGSNTRFYKRDSGDALYRRSMYTFWKRSAPPASMDIFNAPTRESCVVRRERTDTPLQALVTMNDVQFVEAAKALAGNAMESAATLDERLDYMSTRLLARQLGPEERAIAKKAFDGFDRYYGAHPDDARKFLSEGERKPDPGLASGDFAALTMLANELLNLDEVLNK